MKSRSFWKRLGFAVNGVRSAMRTESSFRLQLIGFAIAVALLVAIRPKPVWWAVIMLAAAAVIAAELFNTALEVIVDRLHPGEHPMIGRAKDCAAGAVLVLSIAAVLVSIALIWDSFF